MKQRPSKLHTYMDVAKAISARSDDAQTCVGAVLINNKSGAVLATGHNGFVRGADATVLPNTRPDKYEYILHAEQNLIANCARHGISMEDCMVVCTMSPCKLCMRMLFNSGITHVVAAELYRDFNDVLLMKDIEVQHYVCEGFWRIDYSIHKV